MRKISHPPEFDRLTVRPVASRYPTTLSDSWSRTTAALLTVTRAKATTISNNEVVDHSQTSGRTENSHEQSSERTDCIVVETTTEK